MKTVLIILGVLCAIFFVFQFYLAMSIAKTESQPYDLVKKYKGFEVRYYPAATMATIRSSAKSYRELSSPGFRKLAGFIFWRQPIQ